MTATLQFNLPDDQEDFNMAVNGTKWYLTLWELDQFLRSKVKYDETISEEAQDIYDNIRQKIRELQSENGISFE
jgi:hypothetical protein